MRHAHRKHYKNYMKQVEFVKQDLLTDDFDSERIERLKAETKEIVKGLDSDNDDIRAENEDKFTDLINEIATPEYYDYLSRHYSILEKDYKNPLYRACIKADNAGVGEEWEQIFHGFNRIVESALYRIAEMN